MLSNKFQLKALLRGPNTKRTEELIPSVLYGFKTENIALNVDKKEFDKIFIETGESSLIDLDIDGKAVTVLVHDIQRDHLSGDVIHIDFYKPDLEKKVNVIIPLMTQGEPGGVKNHGGSLVKNINDLEVRAFPNNIPHQITVDVSGLDEIGSEITIKDIILPQGVEILKDPDDVIIIIAAPTDVEKELEKPIEDMPEQPEEALEESTDEEKEEADATEE